MMGVMAVGAMVDEGESEIGGAESKFQTGKARGVR